MKTATPKITHDGQVIDLEDGCSIRVFTEYDESMGPPWKEHDGHGVVSEWTQRNKRAGERVLVEDRYDKRFYNFAETIKLATRDKWGLCDDEKAKLAAKLGREPTRKEVVAESVERDFELLRGWCNDKWHWITVCCELRDEDGEKIDSVYCGGIEDYTDYWKELADEYVEILLDRHADQRDAESLRLVESL